ncbi:myelin regulatory factor-like protein [Synchiropus splendidus]|uniref:myelin regulatory factor-like protein n=1 Tax=Synchiropus splendidus TaxID=270530 RepID=UPI00237DEB96|nr:myelin regulatory factor-like protein [Synchiropus splendidus]
MEPGVGRLPLQVVGENEALQQFFSGQDVSGVLDSSVAVDTSILEQYLSTDMDPNNLSLFNCVQNLPSMLPDSPPDSCSEACSPAQIPDLQQEHRYWLGQRSLQEQYPRQPAPSSSCRFRDQGSTYVHPDLLPHNPHHALDNTGIKSGTSPSPPACIPQHGHHSSEHLFYPNPNHCYQTYTPPTPPSPTKPSSNSYSVPCTSQGQCSGVGSQTAQPQSTTQQTCSSESNKRRRTESENTSATVHCEGDSNDPSCALGSFQMLSWEQYRPEQWSCLLDSCYQTLSTPAYHVETDKGFNYSPFDESFICQKKNHFQVTVHIGVVAEAPYIRTPRGPQAVDHFLIKVFGVKREAPSYQVTIEQSQPDRSKKPFHPVRVSLPGGKITKVTLGRLHFSETTANNMRKKGKPNPDQRYFQMVVALYASVKEECFLLTALMSEKIIVRASNPGQFEIDGDPLWQRGAQQDTLVCQGRVGINTDSPDEALVVCGNAKVMGTVMQPSDSRAKENIHEVDSEQQLKRINQMRLVEFDYRPEFASTMGIDHSHQTGILAQEVKELLPSAVKEVGDVTCADGETIPNFLMVDKDQIFMENVGAVQQLTKLTDNLETRIKELEGWNRRLAKLKSMSGSLRSTGKFRKQSCTSVAPSPDPGKPGKEQKEGWSHKYHDCMQHKVFKASVFTLLATMAFCVISITTLYLVTLKEDNSVTFPGYSNCTVAPMLPTDSQTASPTTPSGPWPPDVDFCDLLYCQQVYCCPSPESSTGSNISTTYSPEEIPPEGPGNDIFFEKLKKSQDWRNTTIHTIMIKESQQVIDSKYCVRDECRPGRFIFRVPISQFVPENMKVTLLMNSTEVLVVHLCSFVESEVCSSLLDINTVNGIRYPGNTQGEHEWPLHVARLYRSSYHFRATVAGLADCSTDHHFGGALFTDYHFHFYRRCND